jgi:cellulose biosynthesis protein BcsQ
MCYPADVGYFSVDGLDNMLDMLAQVKKTFNAHLHLLGILITKFDIRTTLSVTTREAIREEGLPILSPQFGVRRDSEMEDPRFHVGSRLLRCATMKR